MLQPRARAVQSEERAVAEAAPAGTDRLLLLPEPSPAPVPSSPQRWLPGRERYSSSHILLIAVVSWKSTGKKA